MRPVFTLKCPNCEREIALQDAVSCPYCARPLRLAQKQTAFPAVASTIAVIAASIALFIAIAGTIGFIEEINDFRFNLAYPNLTLAVFGILGFAYGVVGAIFSFRRRQIALSLVGIFTLAVSGVAIFLAAFLMLYLSIGIVSLLGIAVVLLSISAAILVMVSKGEFL